MAGWFSNDPPNSIWRNPFHLSLWIRGLLISNGQNRGSQYSFTSEIQSENPSSIRLAPDSPQIRAWFRAYYNSSIHSIGIAFITPGRALIRFIVGSIDFWHVRAPHFRPIPSIGGNLFQLHLRNFHVLILTEWGKRVSHKVCPFDYMRMQAAFNVLYAYNFDVTTCHLIKLVGGRE